jgi:aryl-alcohol dehydrogenase-like predicted oxidoreductase
MDHRLLAGTGVRLGTISLGTMMFGRGVNDDVEECTQMIHRALEAGINHIDTADGYGRGDAERIVGNALAGGRREQVVLATKCYFPRGHDVNERGGSRRWIRQAADASLQRLQTDRIDLFYLHRLDPDADLEESLMALEDLVRQGKILYVGTSGASGSQLVEAQWAAQRRNWTRPVAEQVHYSALARAAEGDILPTCRRHRIGAIVYGPLNGGWLADKYRRDTAPAPGSRAAQQFYSSGWWDRTRPEVDRKFDIITRLKSIAGAAGLTLPELAVGFVKGHPAVTSVLIGPRTLGQLTQLLTCADIDLSPDVRAAVDAVVPPGVDVDPTNFVGVGPESDSPV